MSDMPETYVAGWHDEESVRKMTYNKFGSTGLNVSVLSLGTGGFCEQYGEYSLEDCRATLIKALKSGINYIDTAPWYGFGVSEEVLGKCLEGIPRKAYYVATKIGRYEFEPQLRFDFSAEKTRSSIETSLKKLGVDYIDVLQIHDVEFAPSLDYVFKEALPVLQDAVKSGTARFIGVTGYPVSTLAEFVSRAPIKMDMMLSYSRLTLIDSAFKKYFGAFEGLGLINAAALMMGLLTNGGPQWWHPAPESIKAACEKARNYCKEKNVELAKLAMYYAYQIPGPHTQLVGINTLSLLDSNLDVLFNGLNSVELEVLEYLKKNIFAKLTVTDWEGVEIKALSELLKKKQ